MFLNKLNEKRSVKSFKDQVLLIKTRSAYPDCGFVKRLFVLFPAYGYLFF